MRIVELVLDESNIEGGVNAISIVENPAIESDFIALAKEEQIKLAEVDSERRILMGPALIPNKQIYRKDDKEEYYVYFSSETIRKASQLFLKNGSQSKSTLEHQMKLEGLTVVESWLVDDSEKDKSAFYGLKMTRGTWMVSIKVDNEQVWQDYVKTGKVKGFSIEGYFADKKVETELASEMTENEKKINALKELLKDA